MSLTRAAYIVGFLGLVLLLMLQFVALSEHDDAQASGLQAAPDKALTLDQSSSHTDGDVFYKLAAPSRSTSTEGGPKWFSGQQAALMMHWGEWK